MTRFARALIVAMFLLSLVAWGQAPRVVTQEVGEVQVVFFVCSGDGTAALDVVGSLEEAAVPPEDCPDSFAPPDVALEVVDPEAGTPVAELIFDPETGAVTGTLPPGVYAIRGFEPLTITVESGKTTTIQARFFPEVAAAARAAEPLCADALSTATSGGSDPVVAGGPRLRWSVTMPLNAIHLSQIAFDAEAVVFGMSAMEDSAIAAFESATGALLWCQELDGLLSGSEVSYWDPLVAAQGVVVASIGPSGWEGGAETIGLDLASGAKLWRTEGSMTHFSQASTNDEVVVGISDDGGKISAVAVELATGQERWRFALDTPLQLVAPIVGGRSVFVPVGEGNPAMVAIDIETGLEQPLADLDIDGSTMAIAYAEGIVYAGVMAPGFENSHLIALDGATGAEIWRVAASESQWFDHIVPGDQLYVVTTPDLQAVDAADGSVLWQSALSKHWDNTIYLPPVVLEDQVIGCEPTGSGSDGELLTIDLVGFDRASGNELWRMPLEGVGNFPPPLAADGALFMIGSGELMAMELI